MTLDASSRSGKVRHALAAGIIIGVACTWGGFQGVALGFSGDATGRKIVGEFSVVIENDLTDASNPRSCLQTLQCGGSGNFHNRATCLEDSTSCSQPSNLCTKCVENRGLLASLTLRAPAGTFLSNTTGRDPALIFGQLMASTQFALVQAYSQAKEGGKPSLIQTRRVLPTQLLQSQLVSTALLAARDADLVTPTGGFVLLKVTMDHVLPTEFAAFDEQLVLAPSLETVVAAGPLGCVRDEQDAIVRVTLTQSGGGTVAQGSWRGACDADDRWQTEVRSGAEPTASCVRGQRRLLPTVAAPFVAHLGPGLAEACALARYRSDGSVVRTEQWCSLVELVLE